MNANELTGNTPLNIDEDTTVQEILDNNPEAVAIFEKHGVDVPLECPDGILDTALSICESMCHIDDLDELIKDLKTFTNGR